MQIHPIVWGKPLNIAYDPAGTRGVQVQFHNSDVILNASWPAAEMDNPAQAEHDFTKGDLNCMEVWSTLGMARVWLQTPAPHREHGSGSAHKKHHEHPCGPLGINSGPRAMHNDARNRSRNEQ